jgi:hypothetical protein
MITAFAATAARCLFAAGPLPPARAPPPPGAPRALVPPFTLRKNTRAHACHSNKRRRATYGQLASSCTRCWWAVSHGPPGTRTACRTSSRPRWAVREGLGLGRACFGLGSPLLACSCPAPPGTRHGMKAMPGRRGTPGCAFSPPPPPPLAVCHPARVAHLACLPGPAQSHAVCRPRPAVEHRADTGAPLVRTAVQCLPCCTGSCGIRRWACALREARQPRPQLGAVRA